MRLPEGLPTVKVTGQYLHPDGSPCHGTILVETEPAQLTSADQGLVVQGKAEAQLDESGRLTIELLATDTPGVSPPSWRYRVTERWADAPCRTYSLALPAAEAAVNLPTVPHVGDGCRQSARATGAVGDRPGTAAGVGDRPNTAGPSRSGAAPQRPRGPAAVAAPDAGDPLIYNAREHGLAGDGVTNDQPALQALVDALGAAHAADGQGRVIYCPPGRYSIENVGTVWRNGVSLIGAGPGVTRFLLSNPEQPGNPVPLAYFTAVQHGAGRENHLADCAFERFEIDGSKVHLDRYDVLAKGLGLQYMLRARFSNLYIHDTGATGLGCDYLQDTVIENVLVERCGRLESGEVMGGAGIGIGIGGWGSVERLTIADCTAVANGTNGIFVEMQRDMWPPPRGIRILGCHTEGNRYGISDWGADGLVVTSCAMIGNAEAGFDVSALGSAGIAGRGGMVTNCVIDRNAGDGLGIGNTPGPYLFSANRISHNGRYGYRQHHAPSSREEPAGNVTLLDNGIWSNGLDGVRIDAPLAEGALVDNRIRHNGRRCASATSGSGSSVRYEERRLIDDSADWVPDGHIGKHVTADGQSALVSGNSATELFLMPYRPGDATAWYRFLPKQGTPYRLPDAPPTRAGITIAAETTQMTIRANRVWDSLYPRTQTHGFWITEHGACVRAWVENNYLEGNAEAATRFDRPPFGGSWENNHGLDRR